MPLSAHMLSNTGGTVRERRIQLNLKFYSKQLTRIGKNSYRCHGIKQSQKKGGNKHPLEA